MKKWLTPNGVMTHRARKNLTLNGVNANEGVNKRHHLWHNRWMSWNVCPHWTFKGHKNVKRLLLLSKNGQNSQTTFGQLWFLSEKQSHESNLFLWDEKLSSGEAKLNLVNWFLWTNACIERWIQIYFVHNWCVLKISGFISTETRKY